MKNLLSITLFGLLFSTSVMAASLPTFTYQQYPIADDSSDDVHELVSEGASLVYPEPSTARGLLVKALQKVSKGAAISEYDYLWTQYGLLKSSFDTDGSDFGPGDRQDYLNVAKNVLHFLDAETNTGEWVFTEEGAFRMEVYREAGNGLAWYLMEDAKSAVDLNKALAVIDNTLPHIQGEEHHYIYDTKVRILLKLKKDTEAFEIVKAILDDDPDFGDFQDFYDNNAYQAWLKSN